MYGYKKLSSGLLGVLIAAAFSFAFPSSVLALESGSRQFRGLPQDYASSAYTTYTHKITEKNLLAEQRDSRQFLGRPSDYEKIPVMGAVEEETGAASVQHWGSRDSRQFLGRPQDYERGSYVHEQKMAAQETGYSSSQFPRSPSDAEKESSSLEKTPMMGAAEEETGAASVEHMGLSEERDSRQFLGRPQDYERGSYIPEQEMATEETGKSSRQFLGRPSDYEKTPVMGAAEEETGAASIQHWGSRESRQFLGLPEDYSPME